MKVPSKLPSYILKLSALLLVSILILSNLAYAGSELRQRQEELNAETAILQGSLNVVTGQLSQIQEQIQEIETNLLQVIEDLAFIETELTITNQTLEVVGLELEEAKVLREEQQERLINRARVMYMSGPTTYLDVLLNASSFSDLLKRVNFITRIIDHDQNLVNALRATEELIEENYQTIERHRALQEALIIQETARRVEYEARVEERMVLVNALQGEEREITEGLFALEQASREVQGLIRQAEFAARADTRPSTNRVIAQEPTGGVLAWPVPGRGNISSPFGGRRNPISGRNEHHTGIDIPAPSGHNFVAAEGGVVIFQGWMNGYGNTIIIDHGDGISTLYAHNSRNLVSVGDVVVSGQVIGQIGSTGFSTGPHSHFEVRFNGSPVDPMNFLN